MKQACDIEIGDEAFRLARARLETTIDQLHSDPTAHMEHDQVEALIKKQGTEVVRLLLQGHPDVRCKREQRMESVLGADGAVRAQLRESCERQLMTEFGQVVVTRKGYPAKGRPWHPSTAFKLRNAHLNRSWHLKRINLLVCEPKTSGYAPVSNTIAGV